MRSLEDRLPPGPGRALVAAVAVVVLGVAATGCGDSDGAEGGSEHVDGVTFYTRDLKPGTPIAGPLIMRGTFAIEGGCVVVHSRDLVANPIFIPGGRLSTDHSSMTVGRTTFDLDGTTAVTFGGQVLDVQQARKLGYVPDGGCESNRFMFVYGEGV